MAEMLRVDLWQMNAMPTLEFPFDGIPSIWAAERTILRLNNGKLVPVFAWCYLERSVKGNVRVYNPASISAVRIAGVQQAVRRLSEHYRFHATSPQTNYTALWHLSQILALADSIQHRGRFEAVLSDPNLALQALEIHHRYLKQKVQSHTIGRNTAANQDRGALQVLSIIHERQYFEEIEKIKGMATTTKAAKSDDIAHFTSTLTAIFDSAWRILKNCIDLESDGTWQLSISTSDDKQLVILPVGYSRARLMELAAMSYVGILIIDSGANLAQVRAYEEPENLLEQLDDPERVNLTQRVVKLRAGGKAVPITMTALAFTRLRPFSTIRHQIIELLGSNDIIPFFFKCEHVVIKRAKFMGRKVGYHEPAIIRPLSEAFLTELRKKVATVGADLRKVTLRQLRTNRQHFLVTRYGLKTAADAMGHTIATAVKAYCAAQEGIQANEMGLFLSSLHKTVVSRAEARSLSFVPIAVGGCTSLGNPKAVDAIPALEPNCGMPEGCFFCENFRVHADEEDLRKLLSCKNVLLRIGHLQGESKQTDHLYSSVLGRINVLLSEIQLTIGSDQFGRIEAGIAEGNLTPYWTVKLQQLSLLGFINTA